MNYEVIEIESFSGAMQKYITLFIDENQAKTFPADESNIDFVEFEKNNPDWDNA